MMIFKTIWLNFSGWKSQVTLEYEMVGVVCVRWKAGVVWKGGGGAGDQKLRDAFLFINFF